jgi:transcriptional regulator with XRE-family HTH domain
VPKSKTKLVWPFSIQQLLDVSGCKNKSQLAEKIGVLNQNVKLLESDKISLGGLQRIAKALDVNILIGQESSFSPEYGKEMPHKIVNVNSFPDEVRKKIRLSWLERDGVMIDQNSKRALELSPGTRISTLLKIADYAKLRILI